MSAAAADRAAQPTRPEVRRPLILGHLGNTVEQLRAVIASGADGVEFDVRRTADGVPVLHHDPKVPGHGLVSRLRRAELPAWIPDLDAALDLCKGLVVNIETKNLPSDPDRDPRESTARDVASLISTGGWRGTAIVSSFSLRSLVAVHDVDQSISTALLNMPGGDETARAEAARARGHRALHPHERCVTGDLVSWAGEREMALRPWAVDDLASFRRIALLGVEAVITDDPALIVNDPPQSLHRGPSSMPALAAIPRRPGAVQDSCE